MVKPPGNILRSTLRTTFERMETSLSSRPYASQRGCLPWETTLPKKNQKSKMCRCTDKNIQKTYPLIVAAINKPHPGLPVPGWEKIQKTIPKKPVGC